MITVPGTDLDPFTDEALPEPYGIYGELGDVGVVRGPDWLTVTGAAT